MMLADNVTTTTVAPSTSAEPEKVVLHQLLTNFQFAWLCVFAFACYYVALYLSAVAVGEPTEPLTAPINLLRHVCVGLGVSLAKAVNRRRNRVHVGVDLTEGAYDGPGDDDASAAFTAFNEPAAGLR